MLVVDDFSNKLPVQAILKCSREYWRIFKNSNCILSISVGQSPHEGDMLKATLATINENFKSCTIIVGDSLQRHNISLVQQITDEEAYLKANLSGQKWLLRNQNAIETTLSIPYNITHWDYWLRQPEYTNKHQQITDLCNTNSDFKNAISETANSFWNRNPNRNNCDKAQFFYLSEQHLKEECAVMLIWASKDYQFEIYPMKRNPALKFIHQMYIQPESPDIVRAISIRFKQSITPPVVSVNNSYYWL